MVLTTCNPPLIEVDLIPSNGGAEPVIMDRKNEAGIARFSVSKIKLSPWKLFFPVAGSILIEPPGPPATAATTAPVLLMISSLYRSLSRASRMAPEKGLSAPET
ncbi:hypothetical protein MNBD_NITROSPINAE03-1253 [hydrothermal vent metagenome]|uniref:Uncharacterized protein n=1 Tax=hydrothermal vent metagenome TaxID=652676 RepID=A0A3B1C2T8_9ZZZZ